MSRRYGNLDEDFPVPYLLEETGIASEGLDFFKRIVKCSRWEGCIRPHHAVYGQAQAQIWKTDSRENIIRSRLLLLLLGLLLVPLLILLSSVLLLLFI